MTDEEIRVRLYGASKGCGPETARLFISRYRVAQLDSDDLLAAYLEITKPLREAADELAAALSAMVDRWEPDCSGLDRRMYDGAKTALARYRAVKGAAP